MNANHLQASILQTVLLIPVGIGIAGLIVLIAAIARRHKETSPFAKRVHELLRKRDKEETKKRSKVLIFLVLFMVLYTVITIFFNNK